MPFCPKCRAEYVEGAGTCTDCQVPLVEELTPKDEVDYVELAELQHVPDEISGVMLKGILENNGITTVLRSAKIPWYNGIASTWSAFYWGRILVPKEELERSRKIVSEYLGSLENGDMGEEEPDEK